MKELVLLEAPEVVNVKSSKQEDNCEAVRNEIAVCCEPA